jgi:hypothetical protein
MADTRLRLKLKTATKPSTLPFAIGCAVADIGRNMAYEHAKQTGELIPGVPVLRHGRSMKVITADLERALGIDIADFVEFIGPDESAA